MESKLLLSPEDIETIKAQVKAEVMKELAQQDFHTNLEKDPLNEVRTKYAKFDGPLCKAFGKEYGWMAAWEHIRKLSMLCVGLRYVRDLTPEKSVKAAEVAEYLCKYLIEKRSNNA
jgi:hypothetical protein